MISTGDTIHSDKNNLDLLLDLDGTVIVQARGYWTKLEVRRIAKVTEEMPHGIRYSLSLHNRQGRKQHENYKNWYYAAKRNL